MKQAASYLLVSFMLVVVLFSFREPARSDTHTYTASENGQQYTVTETTSSQKDDKGRTISSRSTEEWRDKTGKLYKKVEIEHAYGYNANDKWTYVNNIETTTIYDGDGGYTQTKKIEHDNKEDLSSDHRTIEKKVDKNGKQISGTDHWVQSGVGKTTKEGHWTWDPQSNEWQEDVRDASSGHWIPKNIKNTPTPKPAPAPSVLPLDKSKDLTLIPSGSGTPAATVADGALPPYADASSELVLNFTQSETPEGGANGVLLVTEDQQGHKKFFAGKPNAGKLILLAALAEGTLKAIDLVKGWDAHGDPITGSRCEIGNPTHIPGTQAVANVPQGQPGITEAASSAQPGDVMTLHLQGTRPDLTRFTLDGKPVQALGISDNSAVIRFDNQTTLAHHDLVMISGGRQTPPLHIAFVQLTPHPLPVSHPGVTETVTIDVAGLAPTDDATMYFQLEGDAASIVGGGNSASVPVHDGKVELRIVGRHTGAIRLRYHLVLKNSQFALATNL